MWEFCPRADSCRGKPWRARKQRTLYGSKWVATTFSIRNPCSNFFVSVPSTGRSGLQQNTIVGFLTILIGFSTLYGSKWVATLLGAARCIRPYRVSVPSTGRSGLQRNDPCSIPVIITRFSTLYGSKWVATRDRAVCLVEGIMFQYPLRVEVGCNLSLISRKRAKPSVSVPSTGRSGLQPPRQPSRRPIPGCFSTLYGSKWVATPVEGTASPPSRGFSTLYGSKWVATR